MHVQINKEINSFVKSSLKFVQLITLQRFSFSEVKVLFVTQQKKQHSSWVGVGTAESMSTFTINMSHFKLDFIHSYVQ